jgi:hypothetical protein
MFRLPVALLAASAFALAACGDDATSTTTPPTTPPTTVAPTTEPTATVPATVAEPTTTSPASVIPTDPAAYATALIEAWERGDQPAAAELATSDAVEMLFSREGGGAGTWSLVGCEGAAGSSYCTFNAGGDPTVIVRVGNEAVSLGQPHAATEIRFEG